MPNIDPQRRIPIKRLRIAVADDEHDMRAFLERACLHLGHEVVVVAENGITLMTGCLNTHPDLVLTDLVMPDVDGLTAIEQIQNHLNVKVILTTAHDTLEVRARAARANVLAFLIKPIGLNELRKAIDSAVSL